MERVLGKVRGAVASQEFGHVGAAGDAWGHGGEEALHRVPAVVLSESVGGRAPVRLQ